MENDEPVAPEAEAAVDLLNPLLLEIAGETQQHEHRKALIAAEKVVEAIASEKKKLDESEKADSRVSKTPGYRVLALFLDTIALKSNYWKGRSLAMSNLLKDAADAFSTARKLCSIVAETEEGLKRDGITIVTTSVAGPSYKDIAAWESAVYLAAGKVGPSVVAMEALEEAVEKEKASSRASAIGPEYELIRGIALSSLAVHTQVGRSINVHWHS